MTAFDIRPAANRSTPAVLSLCMMTSIMAFLLAVAAPSAQAVPLFCSDIRHVPDVLLTGCNLDAASPLAGMSGGYDSRGRSSGDFQEVDAPPLQLHRNPLVQVGPNGLTDEPSEESVSDEIQGNRETMKRISAPPDATSLSDLASTFNKGETWYTMNVDSDGTYLFLGDPEQLDKLDEWSTSEAPDDGLPKGIGIGKKWHF